MIEELKDKYYKFEEQKKIYDKYKSKLTDDEKYGLVQHYLSGKDFWGYSQIIMMALYDVADDSDKFIEAIGKINAKVRSDLAQGTFLDMLTDIGRNKQEIAKRLYEKIMVSTVDDDLKVISGLILGGYSFNDYKELSVKYSKGLKYPDTNSLLKAILVHFQQKELDSETKSFLQRVSKSNDTKILIEFAFVSMKFINKNKKIFIKYIEELVRLNNPEINYLIFDRLTFSDILTKKEYFFLVDIAKDYDFPILNKIIETLRKYPEEHKKITSLLILWLNRDTNFKLNQLDWVLGELVQKNRLFIDEFFKKYKQINTGQSKTYIVAFPHLFDTLAKYHPDHALTQVLKFKLKNEEEKYLFFKCSTIILGIIYDDAKNKDTLLRLIDNLITISRTRKFLSFNAEKYLLLKKNLLISKEDYDSLCDMTNKIIEQLQERKEVYNFKLVRKNLQKYTAVLRYANEVLDNSEEKQKYTPLLWLGENEEPSLEDVNKMTENSELEKAMKLNFTVGKFWPKAYLSALNNSLALFESLPNGKYKKEEALTKNIKDTFSNDDKFWDFLSELIFMSRFSKKTISEVEPTVPNNPNKNLDLKIKIFDRDIYFEITHPKLDRKLKFSNGAVALGNKSFSTIQKKYRQLFTTNTYDEIKKGLRKDMFFVVIDTSSSTIDGHQLLNSFLGSLSYTWEINTKTGQPSQGYMTRAKDSLSDKNDNTDIVSGAIYFKKDLAFFEGIPRIILRGDIILNPNYKNNLSVTELNKLKDIIFKEDSK